MLIGRFTYGDKVCFGIIEEQTIQLIREDIFNQIELTGERLCLEDVTLLAPVEPPLIVGLGRNYTGHVKEMAVDPPERPAIFFKPGRSIIGHMEPVVIPHWATRVDYEGELGVIIGRKMKYVAEESVREHIFGYTCFNDVTERNIGNSGLINQDVSKCCDAFGPCGPWISTDLDPDNAIIRTYRNGELVQEDNTGNTVFSLNQILSFLSSFMTLWPGDLLITGTPAGIGPLKSGDTVEVEIDGIGRLSNPVQAGR